MQAIQLFHYKAFLNYLHKLRQAESSELSCEHMNMITQHEEKLKAIYDNYQAALEQVSDIIRQFDDHKQSIRRLMILHKQQRKHFKKKNIDNSSPYIIPVKDTLIPMPVR